jgi:hypothetical protein
MVLLMVRRESRLTVTARLDEVHNASTVDSPLLQPNGLDYLEAARLSHFRFMLLGNLNCWVTARDSLGIPELEFRTNETQHQPSTH